MAEGESVEDNAKIKKYLSENISLLSEVYVAHKKSLEACEEEITQWKKFIKDYNVLQEKLSTYPDKTSYDEPIPIGSLAYMKGRKIHTNEILVHLGENWFAERSVKDAIEIVKRRKEVCLEKLKGVEKTKEIHEGWLRQTQELAKEEDQVEILEQVSEHDYETSKDRHREMVSRHFALLNEGDKTEPEEDAIPGEIKNFEDLLKRLDILEEEERIKDELTELGEYDDDDEEEENARGESGEIIQGCSGKDKLQRRVSWADQLSEPKDDDEEEEESDSDAEINVAETVRMKYRSRQQSLPTELIASSWDKEGEREGDQQSPTDPGVVEEGENATGGGGESEGGVGSAGGVTPQSPSDLYKMFGPHSLVSQPTKGILKKKGESFQGEEVEKGVGWLDTAESIEYIPSSPDEPVVFRNPPLSESPKEIKNLKPAFSYKVMTRDEAEAREGEEAASNSTTPTTPEEEPRKISRFKANRMKKEEP